MNSKIKESFENSRFYKNYNNIDHVILKINNIKNYYKFSKNKRKENLISIVPILFNNKIKDVIIEDYILSLIHKYGLHEFKKLLNGSNESIHKIIYNFDSINFLLNGIIKESDFDCNERSSNFSIENKKVSCIKILNEKITIGHNIKKYVKYSENHNEDFLKSVGKYSIVNINILINNGADIHYENENALILSIENNKINNFYFLIQKGANFYKKMDILLRVSIYCGIFEIFKYLFEYESIVHSMKNELLIYTINYGTIDILKYLIDNGADIHHENNQVIRILSQCYNIKIDIFKYLINLNLEFYSKNKFAKSIVIKHKLIEFYEKFNIK